jgi:hypothetical protein
MVLGVISTLSQNINIGSCPAMPSSGVESTLISLGSRNLPVAGIRRKLDGFKHFEGKTFSDADYYRTLIDVVFYSGFKAATVSARLDVIHQHFADYRIVARYEDDQVEEICSDPKMIRNRRKIKAWFLAGALPDPQAREELGRRVPVGRLGTADDVAGAVRYLLSDEAGVVTGAGVRGNGGRIWT